MEVQVMNYDCAIIGGGPAGMNAALVLGRARRRTILLDNNKPRNAVTHASHGFLTRDGISPAEFRQLTATEISRYPSVHREECEIELVNPTASGFRVLTCGGQEFHSRKIILATGLKETLPRIDGLETCYGTSIFNCPYCDGWELRDQPLVLLSGSNHAFRLAMLLHNWSRDLIVCTNGETNLTLAQQDVLRRKGIQIEGQPVYELLSDEGRLQAVRFADGSLIRRSGGFVLPILSQANTFGAALGCKPDGINGLFTDAFGRTSVKGVFAAGDTAVTAPSQLVIAAAAGSRAAIGVNEDLSEEAFAEMI
jgi:thioredoxin reductase